jgi:hypothetical protein
MNYETLNSQLAGRCEKSRKLANNTYAERRQSGAIAIRLHQTDIVTFNQDGSIVANTGGWKTSTTKARLNDYLPCRIWQQRGQWFFTHNGKQLEFADGLTFNPDGTVTGAKEQEQADTEKQLRKQILKFSNGLEAKLPLPMPGAGDCFYCQMREVETGKPVGECFHDTSHLTSHMEEGYYVPSLIWRALEHAGCNPQGGGCAWFEVAFGKLEIGSKDTVCRMLRKYLYRQFGLA